MTIKDAFPGQPFTRADFEKAEKVLLRDGRLFNAVVTQVTLAGRTWTVKDFSTRPFFVRPFGRFLLARELKAAHYVADIDGFAAEAFRLDENAVALTFIPGKTLAELPREEVTPAFLICLEELIKSMHRAGIVHLDIRSNGNVLMRPDKTPAVIDFQSALATAGMPVWLKKSLEALDMSGAYKKWKIFQPDAMGEKREAELTRINRWRRLWPFKGYFGLPRRK